MLLWGSAYFDNCVPVYPSPPLATVPGSGYFTSVLLPLFLIVLATAAAGVLAYGTHPGLTEYAHGLDMIMLARRLMWPMVMLSLVSCIALLGLVIANKRRAWWLIGLAPVLALFYHRFGPPGAPSMWVLEHPTFLAADAEPVLADDAWVVGFVFQDSSYALPYWALYATPVVFITDYDKRMVVMWSAHADRAVAYSIAREFKARDLEIVTATADSVLLYDQRLGQFVATITATTLEGEKPVGLLNPINSHKMPWGQWKKLHPATKVMAGTLVPNAPLAPVLPAATGRVIDGLAAEARVALVSTSPLAAIPEELITKRFNHIAAGDRKLLIVRDPATGRARAFDRNVKDDLIPTFIGISNPKLPTAVMRDSDSETLWSADGKAIEGPLKGAEMKELGIEQGLYWGPMKFWVKGLILAK